MRPVRIIARFLKMAAMTMDSFILAKCWVAPVMPTAMHSTASRTGSRQDV